jgi:Ca-activated chloride channel homolog
MFKKLFVFGLLIFGLCAVASAQSGRRIRGGVPETVSTGATREEIPLTSNGEKGDPEVGYSESAPNSARRLSVRPVARNIEKKDKKTKKTETKQPQTTNASATVAGADDDEVLKVETNLVSIPVSVYDRNGVYIPNLKKEDFKIFEDGKEQEVAYFGTSDKPFTVVLLLDVSASTEYKIEQIQDAAIAFINQLKPQDNVMVVQFDSNVKVLTKPEFTNDRQRIYKAINDTGFGGGTSLYDAVDFSLRKRLDQIEGRKAIVLFTDGVDTTSNRANFESTVRDAEESDALIFPIYYNTFLDGGGIFGGGGGVMSTPPGLSIPLPGGIGGGNANGSSEEHARGRAYLDELAAATGGRVFRPNSSAGGLNAAFEGIAEELRRQYNIGYYPQDDAQAGTRKQIRVRVNRPRLVIRAKDSYIVGESDQTQSSK